MTERGLTKPRGRRIDAEGGRAPSATNAPRADRPEATPNAGATSLRSRARFLLDVLSPSVDRFSENEGFRLVAAFSYYATFSIFPLILLTTTVVGYVVGEDDVVRQRVLEAVATSGSPVREVVDRSLSTMRASHDARGLSAFVGLATLLFAASGAFVELDASLNRIWCVPPRTSNGIVAAIRLFLRERLSGFAIVGVVGLTLLLSLVSSALLGAVAAQASAELKTPLWATLMPAGELVLSMTILSAVFTAAFHFIPRSRPPVRSVVGGAVLTTFVLTILKAVFASYLARLTSYSAYGVAGGVLALVTWIYLCSLVIFFGAQITRIYAEKTGAVRAG